MTQHTVGSHDGWWRDSRLPEEPPTYIIEVTEANRTELVTQTRDSLIRDGCVEVGNLLFRREDSNVYTSYMPTSRNGTVTHHVGKRYVDQNYTRVAVPTGAKATVEAVQYPTVEHAKIALRGRILWERAVQGWCRSETNSWLRALRLSSIEGSAPASESMSVAEYMRFVEGRITNAGHGGNLILQPWLRGETPPQPVVIDDPDRLLAQYQDRTRSVLIDHLYNDEGDPLSLGELNTLLEELGLQQHTDVWTAPVTLRVVVHGVASPDAFRAVVEDEIGGPSSTGHVTVSHVESVGDMEQYHDEGDL